MTPLFCPGFCLGSSSVGGRHARARGEELQEVALCLLRGDPWAFLSDVSAPLLCVCVLLKRPPPRYPANKSSQENAAWERAINNVLNPGSAPKAGGPDKGPSGGGGGGASTGGGAMSPRTPGGGSRLGALSWSLCAALTLRGCSNGMNQDRGNRDDSLVGRLMFSKSISQFLQVRCAARAPPPTPPLLTVQTQAPETQMCEFWNLWYNTVSQQLQEDATCDIMFDFSYSEDFNKLYWNSAGPQYLMIQQLVDFFYIVGAPEEEIEKLNVVGEQINPDRIGSWINVSEKGGIDGGW